MKILLGSLLAIAAANTFAGSVPPAGPPIDFAHDVLPLLQRHGCASAYCHGSATGQNGFKLSLFGSDPAADHAAIATWLRGRRLDRSEPERSLLVQKALGKLDHGGGRRLQRDGFAHRRFVAWIAAGAPYRDGPERELQALTIEREPGRLRVRATLRGAGEQAGEVRDVTELALFGSTDPTVVEVDDQGAITQCGPGQAWLTARYGNRTALLRVVQPFGAAPIAAVPTPHRLDAAWRDHLRELGLPAARPVAATALARRLHLDLVGRPPTPHELDSFAADPDVDATARALAARPEFAEVWGEHLARWFEVPAGAEGEGQRAAFTASLQRGDTLPAIARQVVAGELGTMRRLGDPRDRAEYVGRSLLGVRIGCARCHDHPLDRWRRDEHLAFSACFASPRPAPGGGMAAGILFDPDQGSPVAPRLLGLGGNGVGVPGPDRTAAVADFVLATGHDQFARNLANRVFAAMVGQALVEPIDDHRDGNPPLSAAMLLALVEAFHAGRGRLQDLAVFIAGSAIYAVGSDETGGPRERLLAARSSLPLSPAAWARATAAVVARAPGALPGTPLARELALRNGNELPGVLAAGGTTIDALFEVTPSAAERLQELWRAVLSRRPRPDEVERFLPFASADVAAFRDLAQALLTGREFGHRR